jgi:hypothetical protein
MKKKEKIRNITKLVERERKKMLKNRKNERKEKSPYQQEVF